MKFDIDMRELVALEKKIERAANRFGDKPVEDILLKGARTYRKEGKKRAPKGKTTTSSRIETRSFGLVKEKVTKTHRAGTLRHGVVARKLKTRRKGSASDVKPLGIVYAGRGLKKAYHIAPHFGIVHDGSEERFHKSGKSVGVMPANPFMDDAIQAKQPQVTHQIVDDLDALYEKGLKREGVI